MSKLYTRRGDKKMTSNLDGSRMRKDSDLVEIIGILDELNSSLGMVRSISEIDSISRVIEKVQSCLFALGVQLFSKGGARVEDDEPSDTVVGGVDDKVDEFGAGLPKLKNFVLPGGSELAARLHVSRSIARRLERSVIGLSENNVVEESVLAYLNRLSDLLFMLALFANHEAGISEIPWKEGKRRRRMARKR